MVIIASHSKRPIGNKGHEFHLYQPAWAPFLIVGFTPILQQSRLSRAYQRLATSCVIAIPRFDWSSFGWPRRSQGLFAQFPA